MRALRILGGYVACACIFLSISGRAGPTEEAEIVQGTVGSGSAKTVELRAVPQTPLELLPEKVGFKYLHKCDELADLDISADYLTGKKKVIEYGDIVVYLPHDFIYIKRLRKDSTLSNSIASLISSGTFGRGTFGPKSRLIIKVDARNRVLLDEYGTGIKYSRTLYTIKDTPLIHELVGPLCGGQKEGVAVNKILDAAIEDMDKNRRQGTLRYLTLVEYEEVSHSKNDVLLDFVYLFEMEESSIKVPKGEGGVLPINIENTVRWVNQSSVRVLDLYMEYTLRGVNLTSAAFYVPYFDGKKNNDGAIDNFFTVVELLRNHNIFSSIPGKGVAPNGVSTFDARKREDGLIIKIDIDAYINDDNPFKTLYKAIWENNLGPGSSLIAPSRNVPYKVGEGFGGFILLVPFSNSHYAP